MAVDVAATVAGLLFWLIIVTNFASNHFGYQTFGDIESEAVLDEIAAAPKRFKIGVSLIVLEHLSIIALAVMLFIAFRFFNLALAVIWLTSRGIEGVMQVIEKRSYWRLLDIAAQWSGAADGDRSVLAAQRVAILRTKRAVFMTAQILFAVGTFTYSLVFAIEGVVPLLLAWFGVAAAVLYGLGNGVTMRNPDSRVVWSIGGLCILIYEAVLGGWLLFS